MKKIVLFCFAVVCLGLVYLAVGKEKPQREPGSVNFVLDYQALQPGEILQAKLVSRKQIKQAHIRFNGKKYLVGKGKLPPEWLAFIGLDLEIKPGSYQMTAVILFADDTMARSNKEILVTAKDFPVKRLWVNQKFVTPPASVQDRIRTDAELMRSIYNIYTSHWMGDGSFIIPSQGEITPNFGERRFFNNQPRSRHSGLDISSPFGAEVRAANRGKVVLAIDLYFAGKTVIIDHGLGVFSLYCHFSKFRCRRGEMKEKGDIIGEIGATGRVTGPHLHWSIRIRNSRVDPLALLRLDID